MNERYNWHSIWSMPARTSSCRKIYSVIRRLFNARHHIFIPSIFVEYTVKSNYTYNWLYGSVIWCVSSKYIRSVYYKFDQAWWHKIKAITKSETNWINWTLSARWTSWLRETGEYTITNNNVIKLIKFRAN